MQRQGDLLFRTVKTPESGKPLTAPILAYGELTGHAHRIMSPSLSELDSVVDEQGDIFIRGRQEILIGHEEHGSITLPANEWCRITRQREYDPSEALRQRRVAD